MAGTKRQILRLVNRRGTTAQWVAADPVLLQGEFGAEYADDGSLVGVKLGDGTLPWTQLGYATVNAHIADASDAHDASAISVADAGGYYTGTDVEAALQEVGSDLAGLSGTYQPLDSDLTAVAGAGNGPVLAATTASFTTADEAKLDGIEVGATADQTAAEILAAVKTVDGAGSGLDADTVDGAQAADFQTRAEKGQPDGYAGLDGAGKVPSALLPALALTDVAVVADIAARDALVVQEGDVAIVTDTGSGQPRSYIYDGAAWRELRSPTDAVQSVDGRTGAVSLSDLYDAAGAAAAAQAHAVQRGNHTGVQPIASVTGLQGALDAKAPLASPTFTGTPTAPTAPAGTSTTQVATTEFATGAVILVQTQVVAVTEPTTERILGLADAGKVVEATNAAATTVTVPANATVPFPIGTVVNVFAAGAGGVTIAAAAGVTIRSLSPLSQYSEASLRKRAADEWVQIG